MENAEERYVRELFAEKFGVTLRKLAESTVPGQQTADYEVLADGSRIAVLEVKCLEEAPRTPENGWYVNADGWNTKNKDNGPTRVGRLIHSAWKQLGQYAAPKILTFVNDESFLAVKDLEEAFHGAHPYGTPETGYIWNVASKKIAAGVIKDEKGRIDLYIWIDRYYGEGKTVVTVPVGASAPVEEVRTLGPYFRCTTQVGHDLAVRLFACPATLPVSDQGGQSEDALIET